MISLSVTSGQAYINNIVYMLNDVTPWANGMTNPDALVKAKKRLQDLRNVQEYLSTIGVIFRRYTEEDMTKEERALTDAFFKECVFREQECRMNYAYFASVFNGGLDGSVFDKNPLKPFDQTKALLEPSDFPWWIFLLLGGVVILSHKRG